MKMIEKFFMNTVYVKVFSNRFELKHYRVGKVRDCRQPQAVRDRAIACGKLLNSGRCSEARNETIA